MNKILSTTAGLILSASCVTASAAVYNIAAVLDGVDDAFKFSGLHFAGVDTDPDASNVDKDSDPMTGTQITRFLSTPVSGTYDDGTGAINMVLRLDPDNFNTGGIGPGDLGYVDPGTVTFSGNMFFVSEELNPASTLSAIFSDESIDAMGILMNTSIAFDAGMVACCNGASQRPNSFNGTTMSLWGANFDSNGDATLGLDLRIALTAVPVPAAAWLFGGGLLGLVAVARRKPA